MSFQELIKIRDLSNQGRKKTAKRLFSELTQEFKMCCLRFLLSTLNSKESTVIPAKLVVIKTPYGILNLRNIKNTDDGFTIEELQNIIKEVR